MPLLPGSRLGPYEILAPLGAGGMGEVFRARDGRLGREVAIKVLPAEVSVDSERLKRFEKEARSASSLNHPNIVTVYEIGQADSVSYIAMELVEGKTLRELLLTGPLPIKKLLQIAPQVADGLAKAHEAGIVHRDLKPENVMVTGDGRVKILDFGLAKVTQPDSDSGGSESPTVTRGTEPGIVMGTVGYMSPEQASGHSVDFRSDQFSFGSVLYEMATGKRAFEGKTKPEILAAIIREEPQPIGSLNPRTPAPLRWIVERCLAKDPRERYASTEDLARDLATVRDRLSEAATSGAAAVMEARRPRLRLVSALALLALFAVLGGVFFLRERFAERPFPSFQRLTFRRGGVWSARFAPDGRTVIYGAAWDGDPIRLFSTRTEGRESSRFELPDADIASVSSTGEAAILLGRPYNPEPWAGTLARVPLAGGAPREIADGVRGADWSADGKSLAILRRVGERMRIEFPVGKVLLETSDPVLALRVSPKGDRIAFVVRTRKEYSVEVVDLAGKRTTLSRGWRWGSPNAVAWSPDGREVWFSATEAGWVNPIRAVNLSGKQRLVLRLPGWLTVLDISPEGRALVDITMLRDRMFGMAPGESQERELSWHEGSIARDITPDGKIVFFDEVGEGSAAVNTVYVRGTDGSPAKRIGVGNPIAISPDGRWAAVVPERRPTQLELLPTGAGESRVLDGEDKEYVNGGWFPDGRRMMIIARVPGHAVRTYVQDVPAGRLRPITPEGTECNAISPDEKEMLCTDPNGAAVRYPVEGGSPVPVRGLEPGDEPWQWTADGQSLFIGRSERRRTRLFRQNLATGRRELWREFACPDRAGLMGMGVVFPPDGRAYAYSCTSALSDLYLVTGLR